MKLPEKQIRSMVMKIRRWTNQFPYYLSLCTVLKNEEPYLLEWIEYHRMMGVDHFYLYDNESTDHGKRWLQYYVDKGIAEYIYWRGKPCQGDCYRDCIKKHKTDNFWIGFIDIDEFIVPMATQTLPEFLRSYEGTNGLGINWIVYGTSGQKKKTEGLVMERFRYRSKKNHDANRHIKSIVNPRRVVDYIDPHVFSFRDEKFVLDEDKQAITGKAFSEVNRTEKIRVHHYFTRSDEEFREKMIRGRADHVESRDWYDFKYFDKNDELDFVMTRYVARVKARMEKIKKVHPL